MRPQPSLMLPQRPRLLGPDPILLNYNLEPKLSALPLEEGVSPLQADLEKRFKNLSITFSISSNGWSKCARWEQSNGRFPRRVDFCFFDIELTPEYGHSTKMSCNEAEEFRQSFRQTDTTLTLHGQQ